MIGHFNWAIENLSDTLFGNDKNISDFKAFIRGLEDEYGTGFLTIFREALLIEAVWTELSGQSC